MSPKSLSVIVPVYNVETVLERCLRSLLEQTYRCLEIILVNDCSTDNSQTICKKWAAIDERIKLIELPENKGLAEARNVGMQMAHGDYLAFVDSDDYLEQTAYETMIRMMETDRSDLVICNFWNYKEDTEKKSAAYPNMPQITDSRSVLKGFLLEYLPTSAWCKVLKKEIMIPEDGKALWFPSGRRYEDTVVSFGQVLRASKISIIEEPLYYYVQSNRTITAKPKVRDVYNIIQNTYEIRKLLDGECLDELVECYLTSTLVFALQLLYRTDEKQTSFIKKQILTKITESVHAVSLHTIFQSKKRKKLILSKLGMIDWAIRRRQ